MKTVALALVVALLGCRESAPARRASLPVAAPESLASSTLGSGAGRDAGPPACALDNGCVLTACGCACRAFPRGAQVTCPRCETPGDPCEGRRAVCNKGHCAAVRGRAESAP